MRWVSSAWVVVVVVLAVHLSSSLAFYLPGIAPHNYQLGERVLLKVNKLDSIKTQLPYGYYSLPFCTPNKIEDDSENLGEIMSGDLIENSLYKLNMKVPDHCKILCKTEANAEQLKQFADKVEDEYRVHWIIDNLPAATKYFTESEPGEDGQAKYVPHYEKGFSLGFKGSSEIMKSVPGEYYVHNHVKLAIFYHEDKASFEGFRVVGFEVMPFSVKHQIDGVWEGEDKTTLKTCNSGSRVKHGLTPQAVSGLQLKEGQTEEIIWTYDVEWAFSPVKWASRWDLYLKMTDSKIHWFSIVNSIMIVLFLTGMIAMIMMRTLHRDLVRYNQLDSEETQQEETGWKLIHGDVFRAPKHGAMLSVLVGSGVQVFTMTLLTLAFAVLGFLSPANRGGLMTALLLLFVFMGVFAGYYSTRVYKMFALSDWKRNTFWTAFFFPGVCFSVFFVLNLLVWHMGSTGAVPFGTLVALLVLWFGISVPLVYVGSYFAFKKPTEDPPVAVNPIPRMIEEQPWYMQAHFSVLVGGVLPFGAVFIEIFFIMQSVWLHQFYYVFGFLFIVFIILIVTCAEIAIVMCYFQLCGEDYHWWWRAFLTSGSSAVYLYLYSILYFFTKLEILKFVPGALFFGYMSLVSFAFFLLTGTIGFCASYLFVHKIYSSIKVE